jgi:lipoprotein-releasing system permease protein
MARINSEIAFTYINNNRKLTAVAALGVLLGMAIYIFMNSMMSGFGKMSDESIFRVSPHIRIYNEPTISSPISTDNNSLPILINPKIRNTQNQILNPNQLISLLKKQENISIVTPQVSQNVFLSIGRSQLSVRAIGIIPAEAEQMFTISTSMVEGRIEDLKQHLNGIVIGSGISEKLSLKIGDNISILSSASVSRVFKVVGIFQLNNKKEDDSKAYINLMAAQQLLKENNAYITDINISTTDARLAKLLAPRLSALIGYKAEDWESANETLMAASKMRKIIITFVSTMILIIAGFGIYTILNMTVSQKMNDIAILKAMGFEGRDVVLIFVIQAIIIGMIGVFLGVLVALLMVNLLQKVYIGGDIGYFPIHFEPLKFLQGVVFGFLITFLAGFIPARKAAQVDPVSIFRK